MTSPRHMLPRRFHLATLLRSTCRIGLAALGVVAAHGCSGANSAGTSAPRREVWGFTAYWDTASAASIARNGASLDALVTTWIALDTAGGLPQTLYTDSARASRVPARRLALVTSYLHPSFRATSIRRLAANPRALQRAAGSIRATMEAAQHRGTVLDFEALEPGDLPALLAVVRTIADTLHARDLGPVAIAIPATDTLAYPGRALLEAGADFILPMLYDQHWAGGEPGPVAEPKWVESSLQLRVREVGAEKIIAGLPLYGYRWPAPGKGVTVTFPELNRLGYPAAGLVRDSTTGSLRGALPDGGQLWITDAGLLRELVAVVERHGVHRLALWYIGQEDPAVWRDVLPPRPGGAGPR